MSLESSPKRDMAIYNLELMVVARLSELPVETSNNIEVIKAMTHIIASVSTCHYIGNLRAQAAHVSEQYAKRIEKRFKRRIAQEEQRPEDTKVDSNSNMLHARIVREHQAGIAYRWAKKSFRGYPNRVAIAASCRDIVREMNGQRKQFAKPITRIASRYL